MTLPTLAQTAAWIVLVLLLSALLYSIALLMERVGRGVVPMRAIWGGALLTMLALTFTSPLRVSPSVAVPELGRAGAVTVPNGPAAIPVVATKWETLTTALTQGSTVLSSVTAKAARLVDAAVPVPVARQVMPWLLGAWGLAAAGVLIVLLSVYRRLAQRIDQGTPQLLQGVPVVVTDEIGPLVAGVRAPRIVVPRWLLRRTADEQALVLAHEQAHLAARDPLLLIAGAAGTVVMPWNPFSWALLARLRLAIEVDCDQRVLRRGATTGRYGRLLIDLAAAAPRLPLSAPAFSYHTTHLERRLRTMTTPAPRFRRARRGSLLALSALTLVTACESTLPTASEVERMDVAALEARTAAALPNGIDAPTHFFVNGRELTAAEARALPAGKIASVLITKGPGTAKEIFVTTDGDTLRAVRVVEGQPLDSAVLLINRDETSSSSAEQQKVIVAFVRDDTSATVVMSQSPSLRPTEQPLLIVDGERAPSDALKRFTPDQILSIEVIKGPAATKIYGPEAAKGVIVVITKGKK